MRITEVIVTKLFGIFDHTIPRDLASRITIIHAPNGFGKTIILSMLHGLFCERYDIFFSVPFEKFKVNFDNKISVWVDKTEDASYQKSLFDKSNDYEMQQNSKQTSSKITFSLLKEEDHEPKSFSLNSFYSSANIKKLKKLREIDIRRFIDTRIPDLERINSEEWMHVPTGESLSIYEVLDRFGYLLDEKFMIPEWWIDFQNSIKIRFIQTQRLQNFVMDSVISTVEEYARDLKEEIQRKLADSASLSQSLDRTFPERLISQMEGNNRSKLTIDRIIPKLKELEERRSGLMEAGLLDEEADSNFRLPEKTNKLTNEVLAVYIEDVEKKLSVFDDLASKINLFKRMITKRFSYNKKTIISRKSGFHFITSNNGKILPLRALSSGEQHELVLFYQLLFKAEPDSIILIDEPEISLHVAWQVEFLKDIQEIASLAKLDVILATHSPQIINDRWDLTVELKAPVSYEGISHSK